jgi:hypothetical protein
LINFSIVFVLQQLFEVSVLDFEGQIRKSEFLLALRQDVSFFVPILVIFLIAYLFLENKNSTRSTIVMGSTFTIISLLKT